MNNTRSEEKELIARLDRRMEEVKNLFLFLRDLHLYLTSMSPQCYKWCEWTLKAHAFLRLTEGSNTGTNIKFSRNTTESHLNSSSPSQKKGTNISKNENIPRRVEIVSGVVRSGNVGSPELFVGSEG